MALRLWGALTSCPPPKKPRWGPKPITPRPRDRGGRVRALLVLPCVVTFPARKDQNRRHFSILLALPKCVTTWKKRETDNSGGLLAVECSCVSFLPLPLLSLAFGFVRLGFASHRNLVESFGNGLLRESEIHSLWLWLNCLSSFLPGHASGSKHRLNRLNTRLDISRPSRLLKRNLFFFFFL